jgi:hydroxyacid-oxoacid transhydrogenase
MSKETVLPMSAAAINYVFGATREVGFDLKELGADRVMVVIGNPLADLPLVVSVLDSLKREGIEVVLFSDTGIEPSDGFFDEAIRFAQSGHFNGFVGVGGGSADGCGQEGCGGFSSIPSCFGDLLRRTTIAKILI